MKYVVIMFVLLSFLALAAVLDIHTGYPTLQFPESDNQDPLDQAKILDNYAKLPLLFVKNVGRYPEEVLFSAHTSGASFFFLKDKMALIFEDYVLFLLFHDTDASVRGLNESSAKVNYFIGNDVQTDVPTYHKILYEDMYPGIDVLYEGKHGELTYTFTLSPGANPKGIRFSYEGAILSALVM